MYHGFFETYLNSKQQTDLLTELLNDVTEKKPFMPSMKNWFQEFDRLTPKDTKAIFVYYQNIPFNEHFQKFIDGINAKGNIHFFPTARTHNSERQHEDLWESFNDSFLNAMTDVPKINYFLFGTTHYMDQYNNVMKHILPSVDSDFWKSENNVANMLEEINQLLS